MPFAAQRAYLERLPRRQAEMQLLFADVVSLPWMEERDRKNVLMQWRRIAAGPVPVTRPAPRGLLALHGIMVEFVPSKSGRMKAE